MRPGPAADQLCVFHMSLCLFWEGGCREFEIGFSLCRAGWHRTPLCLSVKCKMELKIETLGKKYPYHHGLVAWPVISTTYEVDTGRLQSQDLPRPHTKFQANKGYMVRLCLKKEKKRIIRGNVA